MVTIDPSDLDRAIQKELEDYVERSTETVKAVVEDSTKEAVNELKQHSPKKRGKYARGWTSTATKETNLALTKTIYNRTPGLTPSLKMVMLNEAVVGWKEFVILLLLKKR